MIREKKTEAFYWDKEADKVFNMLKELFIIIFILRMFDPLLRTRLKTNISKFTIKAVISQLFYDLIYGRDN
jgi:beta-galactosidase beta subunit